MKNRTPKLLALTAFSLVLSAPALAQHHNAPHISNPAENTPPVHNGLWWGAKSNPWHEGFMTGYKAGTLHGAGHPLDIDAFPAIELIDGLNSFYHDFRNQNILVDDALVYVCDQLHGAPDEKLKAELLKLRAASAPTNQE